MGQHPRGVPRKSGGMDTSLHLCSFSVAHSYWISQIQSEKPGSAKGRLKSSNAGLVQCIPSLISSPSAALEESAASTYHVPASASLPA